MGLKKNILEDLTHFYCKAILVPPYNLNPWPRNHEFQILVEGFVDIITMYLAFQYVSRSENEDFLWFTTILLYGLIGHDLGVVDFTSFVVKEGFLDIIHIFSNLCGITEKKNIQ